MLASDTVKLGQGTRIYPGGYLHAVTTLNCIPCLTSKSVVLISRQDGLTNEETAISGFGNSFFRVYPNPTSGDFTIEWMDSTEKPLHAAIVIQNMLGEKILESELNNEVTKRISLGSCNAGIYLFRVTDGERNGLVKVVKW